MSDIIYRKTTAEIQMVLYLGRYIKQLLQITQAVQITTIANTTALGVKTPNINTPRVQTKPNTGESVKKVTRTEVKSMQNSDDTVVPLGNDSQVSIINDGVNLPLGLEQEFYVSNNEEGTN